MEQLIEITHEAFRKLITIDIKCLSTYEKGDSRFQVYTNLGVRCVLQENYLCGDQYFIQDINA